MPIDYVEWHTSAQMRSSYSYVVINDLENTINENGIDEFLSSMISYEATKSWLDTSEKILSITEKSEKKVIRDSQFNSKAIETILEVEEKIESLEYGLEKIQAEQKLNAAKRELNQKWYETSYLNASIALGFIKAYEISTDQNYEKLLEIITIEIQKIDETIAQEEWVDGWSILYVDHAKFLLEKAQFQDNNLMATMDLQEGIAYLMVSKELMKSTIEVKEYYANFEEKDYIKDLQAQITIGEVETNPMSNLLIAIFFYSILILIIFLVFAWIVAKNKDSVTIKKELKELDNLEKNLNKEKVRGIITHEEYERKSLIIKNQKKELIAHLKSNNLEREIITKIKLKNRSINKLLIELKSITENKNLETISTNPNGNKRKLLTKMNYENILLTTQNELNETIKNIKLELNSINIETKLKENKKNESKLNENKIAENKKNENKTQSNKIQSNKTQNVKTQNVKSQNTKILNSSKNKKQKITKLKTKPKNLKK